MGLHSDGLYETFSEQSLQHILRTFVGIEIILWMLKDSSPKNENSQIENTGSSVSRITCMHHGTLVNTRRRLTLNRHIC